MFTNTEISLLFPAMDADPNNFLKLFCATQRTNCELIIKTIQHCK